MDAEQQPIIVIKKKGGHGGHHGGAWKVAYADFVTAMMSLFIVLWLMSSTSKQTQEEIAGYFNDPKGTAAKKGSEGKPIPKEIKESKEKQKQESLATLKLDLQKAIENMNLLNKVKKQIEITITEEGLRVELVEDEKGTFFEVGNAQPTPMLRQILKVLTGQLAKMPNTLSIEGYTDAQPYSSGRNYGNWELSTDRANFARREMEEDGLRSNQVSQVRGFADQKLHLPDKPFDAANRRISLIVQNMGPAKDKGGKPGEASKPLTASAEPAAAAPKPSAAEAPKQAIASTQAPQAAAGGFFAKAREMVSHKK